MQQIKEAELKMMKAAACELIDMHANSLNEAFLQRAGENKKLPVSLKIELSKSKVEEEAVDVDATINFTPNKVSFKLTKRVSKQGKLPI
jgi:antitoxin component of RelBE/YafQ-DinJ toxin-antitoxin module